MNRLFAKLLFGSGGLRAYEKDCIEQFLSLLDQDTVQTVRGQLKSVDVVQRSMHDKLVALCVFEDRPDRPKVPNQSAQVTAGRIRLRDFGETNIRCDVVFEKGYLSSLEFEVPPKGLLQSRKYTIVNAVLPDNLKSQPTLTAKISGSVTGPLLSRIAAVSDLQDVLAPPTDEAAVRAITLMGTVVPTDFVDLIRETDGFRCGDWEFLGTRTRRIIYPEADYTLIAETQNGEIALAIKDGQPISRIFRYDAVDGDFSETDPSLIDALLISLQNGNANVRREN